ncbi:GyrI-like domain-containing protein [Methanobrevibacter sp. DSM 116169]|uniref:GyrI-like domain-containing protein n=1 Tax=Methanobrevibacter sp. DSM 116169 TaxID=3242727 RepID=UPI0038FCA103
MKIEDKIIPDQKLAITKNKRPIVDVELVIAQLMGWVESEEVETIGSPFIIFYSPRFSYDPEDVVFDIGIPINGDPEGTDIIEIVDLIEHNVLSATHKGSYDNIKETYEKMVDEAEKNNFDIIGSPKEVLIKSKIDVDDDNELITEIQLPIIKM